MIFIYSQLQQGQKWLKRYQGKQSCFACILGFTATGLIPGISAAGATPEDRLITAIADGEFLVEGAQAKPKYPLPYLTTGISPVLISRAIAEFCELPIYLFNAGLRKSPPVPAIDLQGIAANCVSSGHAMTETMVKHLFSQGMKWGAKLAANVDYIIIGECVVGGTTTALAVLSGLGIKASGMVNSSHPHCNHQQKWSVVQEGLKQSKLDFSLLNNDPFAVVAAVGDPMQIVAAGMAIAASIQGGVLLAGGTQMLAVYALIKQIIQHTSYQAQLEQIVVGTTRWVAEDATGDTVKLAHQIEEVSLLATGLNFATSRYPGFRAYEAGYVKEGVGAGGCAIYAHLSQGKTSMELLTIIEDLFTRYRNLRLDAIGK